MSFTKAMLMLAVFLVTAMHADAQLSLCRWHPWNLTGCHATVTYQDGTKCDTPFYPQGKKTIRSCYKFGCHPYFCADWRAGIRSACQEEYEVMKSKAGKLFCEDTKKTVASVSFEGCAEAQALTGPLGIADRIVRKMAPASYYNVCTTDPEATEGSLTKFAQSLWEKVKQFASRESSPSAGAAVGAAGTPEDNGNELMNKLLRLKTTRSMEDFKDLWRYLGNAA